MNTNVVFFIPEGWSVVEHTPHQFVNPKDVNLVRPNSDKPMSGFDLLTEFSDKKALNSNELDYLLACPELISDDWKGMHVYFWGTIYRKSEGRLVVRYLYFGDNEWKWGYSWLGSYFFRSTCPAAVAT